MKMRKPHENEKTTSRARPQYYGRFINEYIYESIEADYVKAEINNLNITDDDKHKARFHQWLTDFGINQLTLQIGRVMGKMEDAKTLDDCKLTIARMQGLTILEEDLFGATEKIIKKTKNENAIKPTSERSERVIQNITQDSPELFDNQNFENDVQDGRSS